MNGGVLIGTRVMFGRILVCSALADKGGGAGDDDGTVEFYG